MQLRSIDSLQAYLDVGVGCLLADNDVNRGPAVLFLLRFDPGEVKGSRDVAFEPE